MMRQLLAVILLLLAAPALATSEAHDGDDWTRLFDSPCVSMETIARIPQAQREGWSKAQGFFGGERFFGCWRWLGDTAYILWEDGDQGMIPKSALVPVLDV